MCHTVGKLSFKENFKKDVKVKFELYLHGIYRSMFTFYKVKISNHLLWVFVSPVQVPRGQVRSVVTDNHTIWIQHRYKLEHKLPAEFLSIADEKMSVRIERLIFSASK